MTSRPLLQALLENDPISAGEVREFALRHVLHAPFDGRRSAITAKLIEVYWMVKDDPTSECVPAARAYQLVKDHFIEGFCNGVGRKVPNAAEFWVWPASLPHPQDIGYAEDFLIMAGLAIGTQEGVRVAQSEQLSKKLFSHN